MGIGHGECTEFSGFLMFRPDWIRGYLLPNLVAIYLTLPLSHKYMYPQMQVTVLSHPHPGSPHHLGRAGERQRAGKARVRNLHTYTRPCPTSLMGDFHTYPASQRFLSREGCTFLTFRVIPGTKSVPKVHPLKCERWGGVAKMTLF